MSKTFTLTILSVLSAFICTAELYVKDSGHTNKAFVYVKQREGSITNGSNICAVYSGDKLVSNPRRKSFPTSLEPILTFTYLSGHPSSINLFSSYPGPANPDKAFYDSGQGWTTYTGRTIPVYGNRVRFKGDWRDSEGRFYRMFDSTFGRDNPVKLTGKFDTRGLQFVPEMFYSTFQTCSGLTGPIPKDLFGDVSGTPQAYVFYSTFYFDGNLSEIPPGLFSRLSGNYADSMFRYTFYGCIGITNSISDNFFGNLSGNPSQYMFTATFGGCQKLTGDIPNKLFGNISGTPATGMFRETFMNCTKLSGNIPVGLFGDISGTLPTYAFLSTFINCYDLTGPSALMPDGTTYLYQQFSGYTTTCYQNCTNLSDYASIPTGWK